MVEGLVIVENGTVLAPLVSVPLALFIQITPAPGVQSFAPVVSTAKAVPVNPVGEPMTRLEKLRPVGAVQVPMAAVQAWNIIDSIVVAVGAVKPKVYVAPEAAGTAVDIVRERDVS
ncbi:MAG TPA: hypothetical protein VFW77_03880 [Candidatus Saccharimonadales bacterium]|nr:hypothetical protein [Candidatus Saccharimonadales bacterium]